MSLKFREGRAGFGANEFAALAGFSADKKSRLRIIRLQSRSFSASNPAEASSPVLITLYLMANLMEVK